MPDVAGFGGPNRLALAGLTAISRVNRLVTEILYDAAEISPPLLGRKVLYTPCTGPATPPSRLSGLLITG